jgi:hypothetical protein
MNNYLDRLNLRPFEKRLVVGVAAMVFVVMNIWFVLPHFSDWSSTQRRMAKAQKTLADFQAEIRQMSSYQRMLKESSREETDVPAEDQAVQFQRAVQNQSIESRVELTSQRVTSRTNQFFLELSQNISVTSGEQELVDFLYNLGAANSLIRVRDLSLHTDMARMKLSAIIKLVASYQKAPTARATAAGAPSTPVRPVAAPARSQIQPAEPKIAPLPAGPGTPPGRPASAVPKPIPQNPR